MRYYISDLHFFHENMNHSMDKRGFANADEMNAFMLRQWNSKVRKNDEVVILGDLSVARGNTTNELIQRLNGKKYLIIGNHDRFLGDKEFDRSLFQKIQPYAEMNDNGRKVILCHYPIFCYNGQYRMDENHNPKVYMLYGHVHNTYDEVLVNEFIKQTRECKREIYHSTELVKIPCNMINCFCLFSNYVPLTLDEWINVDNNRRANMPSLIDFNDQWKQYL